jgi:hypothetical protein
MSCGSYDSENQSLMEGFNAGTPMYLGYAGYPGSDFPSQCGGGYGYGGYGHYGTYGGCAAPEVADNKFTELDSYNAVHEPGCWSPQCQTPYSMPYQTGSDACGNGNCGKVQAASEMSEAAGSLVDFGLTNGNGLKGHLQVPGINVNVDFYALLRYAILILIVATIAYYLLGLRIR